MGRERADDISKDMWAGMPVVYVRPGGTIAAVGHLPENFGAFLNLSFVRPRGYMRCCCTKSLRTKTDRAVAERICHCSFRYVRTENGVAVYKQVK